LIIVHIAHSFNPARDSPIRAQVQRDRLATTDRIAVCRPPTDARRRIHVAPWHWPLPRA
jgi:hypothetical protein